MNLTEKRFYSELYSTVRGRARKRKLKWDLSRSRFDQIVARADGRCEVTGIPFSFDHVRGVSRRPWVPSLDRKNSRKGYTKENVRLVCVAANLAMNEWGVSVLKRLADSMTEKDITGELLTELQSTRDIRAELDAKPRRLVQIIDKEIDNMVDGVDFFTAPCRCVLFTNTAANMIKDRYREENSG